MKYMKYEVLYFLKVIVDFVYDFIFRVDKNFLLHLLLKIVFQGKFEWLIAIYELCNQDK